MHAATRERRMRLRAALRRIPEKGDAKEYTTRLAANVRQLRIARRN
jgi:hypothetical protein